MTEVRSNTFTTHDGVSLFYRHWPAADVQPGAARRAIVMFHRGHELSLIHI